MIAWHNTLIQDSKHCGYLEVEDDPRDEIIEVDQMMQTNGQILDVDLDAIEAEVRELLGEDYEP
jgi:hypothetical protein